MVAVNFRFFAPTPSILLCDVDFSPAPLNSQIGYLILPYAPLLLLLKSTTESSYNYLELLLTESVEHAYVRE